MEDQISGRPLRLTPERSKLQAMHARHQDCWARFDDFGANTAFALYDPVELLVASSAEDVVGVLAEASKAARAGHWVAGYVAYDAAPGLDLSLTVRGAPWCGPSLVPLAWFGVFDRRNECSLIGLPAHVNATPWSIQQDQLGFARSIAAVKRHIADGATYQLNLTTAALGTARHPIDSYAAMAHTQGGRYNAFLQLDGHSVLCASPELFFDLRGGRISTRPMKGTSRRGRSAAEDRRRAEHLATSVKDRAENVMIVDLMRNDLGRIAQTGSVRVDRLVELERYDTVWQLTSTISALVTPGTSLGAVFSALFPSGSVTGAPKRRTMQLIAELEPEPRGLYCGAVGWIAPSQNGRPADARFAVAIRTAVVDNATGAARYGVGCGITWDSDPAAEWDELLAKTAILDAGPAGVPRTHPHRPG